MSTHAILMAGAWICGLQAIASLFHGLKALAKEEPASMIFMIGCGALQGYVAVALAGMA